MQLFILAIHIVLFPKYLMHNSMHYNLQSYDKQEGNFNSKIYQDPSMTYIMGSTTIRPFDSDK